MNEETKKPQNPTAFPFIEQHGDKETWSSYEGMSLRDYFAGLAMRAFISTYSHESSASHIVEGAKEMSSMAYEVADAMLKQREDV